MSRFLARRDELRAQQRRQEQIKRLLPFFIIGVVAVVILAVLIIPTLIKPSTNISLANGSAMGNPDAPVKVIEFGDYQCPNCASFFAFDEPEIVKAFVTTGKITFSFSPFSFLGQESIDAAQAAYCARDQNKFWEYHDALYNHQGAENKGAFTIANLERYAEDLGLKMDAFKPCLESKKYASQVDSDNAFAVSNKVKSTPSFMVDGKVVSQEALVEAINVALKAKGK